MPPYRRIVWKLIPVVVVTILLVIGVSVHLNNTSDEQHALASAREVARFNSETILQSLRRLMMTRDNTAIRELIDDLAEDNPIYTNLRLVAHRGEIVASGKSEVGSELPPGSRACRVCHDLDDPADRLEVRSRDQVVSDGDDGRVISVVTPVFNEPRCRDADCHAHADSLPVLGLLEADFSLRRVDELTASRSRQTIAAGVIAILLSTIVVWLLMSRLLSRPLRALAEGTRRIADSDFTVRIEEERKDEIGLLASSFNDMTVRLSGTLSELESTRDHLEGIVENSADIIITVSPEGLIQTFNRGAEASLGYSREEVIGRRIQELFADPLEREAAIARLRDADNVANYETRFRAKNGETRDVILTLSRLRDPDGRAIGTFGISKDVTKEKALESRLLQAEKFSAIGQAVAGLLHTMKNMLNSLTGGSYLVRTGLAKDDRKLLEEGWAMVSEGIDNMKSMSSGMLNYVREQRPDLARTDLAELVSSLTKVFRQTARDKGVGLEETVSDRLPPVLCDARLVRSAVMDLLSNALDACLWKEYEGDEQPAITVSLEPSPDGSSAVIEVGDNGCGMSEEVRRNVFTPFFSTKKKLGTGLGLALTHRMITVHGGVVEVESETDRGALFRITLPAGGPEDTEGEP